MSEKLFWAAAVVVVVAALYGYWPMSLKDFIFALAMYTTLFVLVLFNYVFGSSGGEQCKLKLYDKITKFLKEHKERREKARGTVDQYRIGVKLK